MTTESSCRFSRAECDAFVGKRVTLERYLVVSLAGFFPVLLRTGEKSLAVVFRTGAPHIGASGTLSISTSSDGGVGWSDSVRVHPRWEDARNPGFGRSRDGRLIVSYWTAVRHAYREDKFGLTWEPKEPKEIERIPALSIRTSDDGGATWSAPRYQRTERFYFASPYGRIVEGPDGALLMSIYGRTKDGDEPDMACGVLRSRDGGDNWNDETIIARGYNETALLPLPNGEILAAARSQEDRNIATFRSDDSGGTWRKTAEVTRRNEHPADLTLLESGNVLLTFGRRIRPFGCGALLSTDAGRTWHVEAEALLAGDAVRNSDTGYPSTVQLADGTIVTALYFASGSAMSDAKTDTWGEVSCQIIRYDEGLFGL